MCHKNSEVIEIPEEARLNCRKSHSKFVVRKAIRIRYKDSNHFYNQQGFLQKLFWRFYSWRFYKQ